MTKLNSPTKMTKSMRQKMTISNLECLNSPLLICFHFCSVLISEMRIDARPSRNCTARRCSVASARLRIKPADLPSDMMRRLFNAQRSQIKHPVPLSARNNLIEVPSFGRVASGVQCLRNRICLIAA